MVVVATLVSRDDPVRLDRQGLGYVQADYVRALLTHRATVSANLGGDAATAAATAASAGFAVDTLRTHACDRRRRRASGVKGHWCAGCSRRTRGSGPRNAQTTVLKQRLSEFLTHPPSLLALHYREHNVTNTRPPTGRL